MPKNLGGALYSSPLLIWTESKRTAAFSQDTFPNITLSPSLTGPLQSYGAVQADQAILAQPFHARQRAPILLLLRAI